MDRDELLRQLAEHGCDTEALKEVPEPALMEMLRVCDAKGEHEELDEDGNPKRKEEEPNEYDEEMPPEADEEMKTAYREKARKYADAARKMMARCGEGELIDPKAQPGKTEGVKAAEEPNMPKKVTTTQHFSEATLERIVARVLSKQAGATLSRLEKFREQEEAAKKVAAVDAICERLGSQGKLPPAEAEDFKKALLDADCTRTVEKFTEKGKAVNLTAFDRLVRMVERRPSRFAERFGTPVKGVKSGDGSDRKEWAKDTYQKFSESFKAVGVDEKTFVETTEKASEEEFERTRKQWDGRAA